jgi:copper chaperone NosL
MNTTRESISNHQFASERVVVLIIALLLLIACGEKQLKPVGLLPEDICTNCKMAISEKQFAAEFITRDGDAVKFDDIGCMSKYLNEKNNRDSIAGYFVNDFNSKQWVRGEEAFFVSSPGFQTPMSGGIVAFKDKSQAEASVAARQSRLLTFAEVISGEKKTGE